MTMPIIKKRITNVVYQLISTLALVMVLTGACSANSINNDKEINMNQGYYLSPAQEASLTKQANGGDAKAAFRLWSFYDFVKYDYEKGFYWLTKAAEGGNVIAQYNLGSIYIIDKKHRDLEKARYWLEKAASSKGDACFELAKAYDEGLFGARDPVTARSYYLMGAKEGNRLCWERLAEYLHAGIGGEKDDPEAYYWISLEARCVAPDSIGGKQTWKIRDEIAQNLSLPELENQWRRIDDYIQLVRSKKIVLDTPPFLEGLIAKESSDEGVKFADEREKEHRETLRLNKRTTKE